MPIGWENGDGRVVHRRSETVRRPEPGPIRWRDQVTSLVQTGAALVGGYEPVHREVISTVWTRWTTVGDERVCPICGPFAGRVWPIGEGPSPPLHPNCRCSRAYAFTTFSVRS